MASTSPSNSNADEREELADSWWAAVARRLLHRIQVEVIEAMQRTEGPISARELAKVIAGVEPSTLANHHLRRLRALGAIEYAGGQVPRNPLDTPYRLVRELSDDGA
jgi:DNA-binding HxlR family transcriptional regulator